MNTRKRLIKTDEAAELLDVSAESVRLWLQAGQLEGHKIGRVWRVHRKDVLRVINGDKILPPATAHA